jgi:hypothetical protein
MRIAFEIVSTVLHNGTLAWSVLPVSDLFLNVGDHDLGFLGLTLSI